MAVSREYKIKVKATLDASSLTKELAKYGKDLTIAPKYDSTGVKQVTSDIDKSKKKVDSLGKLATSVFGKFNLWYGIAQISHKIYQGIGDVVTNTIALDTAMTGLSKVTDISKSDLSDFAVEVGNAGVELGKTTTQMVDASTVFAQAGWSNTADLKTLSTVSSTFSNISDTEMSSAESADFLISTMKAFNLTADDTTHIIDAVNEVSNNYAVSSGDLASSIGKVASTMELSGTSFEQTLGLMTGVTEITRDSSKAATGLKTISLRLQGMEEDSDGVAQSVDGLGSKMQGTFSKIGVSLVDSNGNMNSFYDNIISIGKVWPQLTESEKGYYAEQAAGKNQANVFAALMQNTSSAISATATAYNSAGSAAKENEKQMESVQGRIDILKAKWEQFTTSLISSDFMGTIADMGSALIDFVSSDIGKAVVGFATLTASIGLLKSKFKIAEEAGSSFVKIFKTFDLPGMADGAGLLSKAVASIGGPAVLASILGLGVAIASVKKSISNYNDASGLAQTALIENATTSKQKYDESKSSLDDLQGKAESLKTTIDTLKSKDSLDIVDQQNLKDAEDSLVIVMQQIVDMQKIVDDAKTSSDTSVTNAMNEKNKTGFGLGDVSNKNLTMAEEASALMKAMNDINIESGKFLAATEGALKNEGDVESKKLENQENKLTEVRDNLVKLQETAEVGSDNYKTLGGQISQINSYLYDTVPLMKSNVAAAQQYSNLDLNLNGTAVGLDEISTSINTQIAALSDGSISSSEYFNGMLDDMNTLATTVDVNGNSMSDILNMTSEDFDSMTTSQQQDAIAAIEAWQMYDSSLKGSLDAAVNNFDATKESASSDIDGISTAMTGMLGSYTSDAGLIKTENDGWVDSTTKVADEFANTLQSNIDSMNGLKAVSAIVASSQTDLATVTAEGFDSTSAAGQQAISNLNTNTQASFSELAQNNSEVWTQLAADITKKYPDIASKIMDSNGNVKDDMNLTADEMQTLYNEIGDNVEDSVKGNADSISGLTDNTSEKSQALLEKYAALNEEVSKTGTVSEESGGTASSSMDGAKESVDGASTSVQSLSDKLGITGQTGSEAGDQVASGVSTGVSGVGGAGSDFDDYSAKISGTGTVGIDAGNYVYGGTLIGAQGATTASSFFAGLSTVIFGTGTQGTNAGAKMNSGISNGVSGVPGAVSKIGTIATALAGIPTTKTISIAINVVKWITEKLSPISTETDHNATGSDYIDKTKLSWVGENGPELMMLPKGSGIANARETANFRKMLSEGAGVANDVDSNVLSSNSLFEDLDKVTKSLNEVLKTSISYFGNNQSLQTMGSDNTESNFNSAYNNLKKSDTAGSESYLNKLDSLNKKYFGDKAEYLKEYQKYEMEVYNGRIALEKNYSKNMSDEQKTNMENFKDQFQTQADSLDYMLDKNIISEDDYYLQLSQLNDKYFKGKYAYLDEYSEYELKVYNYLIDKEKDRIDELSDKVDGEFSATQSSIETMIDAQIAAEEKKLDLLSDEEDKNSELEAIEEARQALAEAQQKNTYIYRAGVGFEYDANADDIEEASKALNELLESQSLDKKKSDINDEIDRLNDLKDAWDDSLNVDEAEGKYKELSLWMNAFEGANYATRLQMAEDFKKSYSDALLEIANEEDNIEETASVNLQNFSIKGYANGADSVNESGYAIVGEQGPELINLPKNSGVMTAKETKNLKKMSDIVPNGILSSIDNLVSKAVKIDFKREGNTPNFNFNNWNIDASVADGLTEAIQNNLKQTVTQFMLKRK